MAAEIRDWVSALPNAAMAEIARRLPCRTDRAKMAAVCRTWRAASARLPARPPALPWLLIPTADSTRVHCFLRDDYHAHHRIDELPHTARYFGSHDGAWLFVAYGQTHSHELFNLHDGPIQIRFLPEMVDNHLIVILAATLSAPPYHPYCVGACIFTRWPEPDAADDIVPSRRRFAWWRMGSQTANDFMPDPPPEPEPEPGWPTPADLEVEDVVFHGADAAFHFLTRGEHIFVCRPAFNENLDVTLVPHLILFEPGRDYDGLVVHARYLVSSGMELLMVVRFTNDQLMTSSFRVFRMISRAQMNQADGDEEDGQDMEEDDFGEVVDPDEEVEEQGKAVDDLVDEAENPAWSWGELHTLDGRMLFVGRGCSRSYNAAQYPELKAGIYFFDDRSFYDEEMMFGDDNEREYPCHDNGMWLEGPPPVVQRCPPENPPNHSPPAWLLP